jgi:(p)ppGpp synthase/HD superfamily hydrolase
MTVNYLNDIQIKRIISRLKYHNVDENLINRVSEDINFEANYEKFLRLTCSSKSKLVYNCLEFASKAHQGQTYRKSTDSQGLSLVPYLNHPVIMSIKAIELGFNEIIIAGCLVHDTFKATKITEEYLIQELDPRISKIVLGFNKEPGESKTQSLYRNLNSLSYESKAIKILDKWHSLLRSFTLYDPDYQNRLIREVTQLVSPCIDTEFGDIKEDCNFFIKGIEQLKKPIFAY